MNELSGIICIDKPQDFTSFDVVAVLRGMTGTKKIGHAGTLDPMATGVLPAFIGRATRCCDLLSNQDKRYTARLRLGITTTTQDITGEILEQKPSHISAAEFAQVLQHFLGSIEQTPPMYSAVKIDGKRLYELARQGKEVSRPSRTITIYELRLLSSDEAAQEFEIDVFCSKGTYIRTLCDDIGKRLGCGATLVALRRTMAAGYTIEQCYTLDELQKLRDAGTLQQVLLPIESAFSDYEQLVLTKANALKFQNGVKLDIDQLGSLDADDLVSVLDESGQFLGLGYIDLNTRKLRIKKIFHRYED
ncbi:tRNA pseudouridine(55) synthase TruB [Candidatus Soleaferrea massiliensis]|uniref:tRNA pseudouridine(55) synthase TruB n=1 Tax=Candidatus Soleaferrea massiliensis TaxID=1470354 RepID=UPI00058EB1F6|nr:tRNA pseudouridine(55) synthase TruB [Candidatus Soleaferrea massiliensis]